MWTYIRVAAFPIVLMSALGACVGGGGAGSGRGSVGANHPVTEVPFTSFSAIGPNQRVVMPGMSQTGSGNTGTTVDPFGFDPVDASDSNSKLTFDANGSLAGFSISTPQSNVSFGASQISCATSGACAAANDTSVAVVMDPGHFDWNYQTFGVWLHDIKPESLQAGAISAGAVSPVSALPLSTGEFTGHAGGFYVDSGGTLYATDAQMKAIANFGDRNILFSTSGTTLSLPGSSTGPTLDPNLNLSGTLTYDPSGINRFSGSVQTENGVLTGDASGRFYGPNAQEIGGVYGLGSTTGSRMIGAFGGSKR